MRHVDIDVEVFGRIDTFSNGKVAWQSGGGDEKIELRLVSLPSSHGFGVSEMATVAISIGVGVTANLLTDALRAAVGAAIKRVEAKSGRADGSDDSIAELLQRELASRDGAERK